MMWQEFEQIAGYEVTYSDYHEIIEPMYMATNLSKQDFVKCLDSKRFSLKYRKQQMVKEMKQIARHLAETCEHYTDYDAIHRLENLSKDYANLFWFKTLKWHEDMEAYCFFKREYFFKEIKRGCTYPCELVIGRGSVEYERIKLVA